MSPEFNSENIFNKYYENIHIDLQKLQPEEHTLMKSGLHC